MNILAHSAYHQLTWNARAFGMASECDLVGIGVYHCAAIVEPELT